jgi:hypothetical protein
MSVIFIQNPNNLPDAELMVDEQVADGYLSLDFGIQAYRLGRGKLPAQNRKPVAENRVFHQAVSP